MMLDISPFLHNQALTNARNYLPLLFREQMVGFFDKEHAERVLAYHADFSRDGNAVRMRDHDLNYEDRSMRLDQLVREIYDTDQRGFGKWCPETTPVVTRFGATPVFDLQRAAVAFFGVLTSGVHLNAFKVRNGVPFLQIAKRASHLTSQPNLLDQTVAGFLPIGESPREKLVEEAYDEAGLDGAMIEQARAVGSVGFCLPRNPGLQRGSVYIFDLEVPEDHAFKNLDGEVDSYLDISPEDAARHLNQLAFKFDSGLVVADFLLRHGHLNSESPLFLNIRQTLIGREFSSPLEG